MINRSFDCAFAFVEMISARALVYRNRNTLEMLSTTPADRPLGVQLLGDDPEIIREALDILQLYEFDIIDFNAACPVGKVTGRGEGAGLLKEPRKLGELLKVVVAHATVPVTVKIRAGWDDASINASEIALYARDAGVDGLFIHGRTRMQGYKGRVDYTIIREVKNTLDIPVIASGDAFSPHLIKKMFDETGCDGVAIARGALGNPWLFRETIEFLENGTIPRRPGLDEVADTMIRHLNLCTGFYGETVGAQIFRKFFAWYTRGFPGMRHLRIQAFSAKTKEQMLQVIGRMRTTEDRIPCHGAFAGNPDYYLSMYEAF
jgi:tRNA-dihydrouridine synthase B